MIIQDTGAKRALIAEMLERESVAVTQTNIDRFLAVDGLVEIMAVHAQTGPCYIVCLRLGIMGLYMGNVFATGQESWFPRNVELLGYCQTQVSPIPLDSGV